MTTLKYRDHIVQIFLSGSSLTVTVNKIVPPFMPACVDEETARLTAESYIDFVYEIQEFRPSEMHASQDDLETERN